MAAVPSCSSQFLVVSPGTPSAAPTGPSSGRTLTSSMEQLPKAGATRAAQAAKKNRRAFFELMRKYKIESGEFLGGALQAQPH